MKFKFGRRDFGGVLTLEDKARAALARVPPQTAFYIYGTLGQCYETTRQYAKAIVLHEEGKKIADEVGDLAPLGTACGCLRIYHLGMGQYGKAIAVLEEYKKSAEEMGDGELVGDACGNMGVCYYDMGQYGQAIALLEHKKIAGEIGDRAGVARTCSNLGNCHAEEGRLAEAIAYFNQSYAISREAKLRGEESNAAALLGTVLVHALRAQC